MREVAIRNARARTSIEAQELLAEIRHERRGNLHATVRLQIIFQQRGEHARHREAGAIERVHEFRFAGFLIAEADLCTARLE